ncbi:hypothetical protein LCGC14_1409760 [marine sediment metagenome]|uniref:Rad50/SbcC-type AAA domain-containing protein n=1 Tax=marine sediment metagenome TaxID=412755 RepID=A0A0F9JUN7_9ZZZZ
MSGHIEYYEIFNYQSWEYARFDLSPGVNVFVGPSDDGKSAGSIRALLWAIENMPQDDTLYRSWSTLDPNKPGKDVFKGETRVNIKLADHPDLISRYKKGMSINAYSIGSQVLNKPGKTVPDAISRILNIQTVNIHRQSDGPFFISMSDPDKARYLNELVNLDIIARTQSNILSRLTTETTSKKAAETTLAEKTEDLANYDWIDQAEHDLAALEIIEVRLVNNTQDRDGLRSDLDALAVIDRQAAALAPILGAQDELDRLYTLTATIAENRQLYTELTGAIAGLGRIQDQIDQCDKILAAKPAVDALLDTLAHYDQAVAEETDLINRLNEIDEIDKQISAAGKELTDAQADLKKSMPAECPLCGRDCDCRKDD